jgi:hypothetical protein
MKYLRSNRKEREHKRIQAFIQENGQRLNFLKETEGDVGVYYATHNFINWWNYLTGKCLHKPGTCKLLRADESLMKKIKDEL